LEECCACCIYICAVVRTYCILFSSMEFKLRYNLVYNNFFDPRHT
jgi:hypothetical protein